MSTLKQLVDETTNIKNELRTCHSNLKNNLIKIYNIIDLINYIINCFTIYIINNIVIHFII